jgi:hypothetical protein
MKNTANTQEITITNACTTTAIGNKRRSNAKPVLCITTGEVFASLKDTEEYYGLTPGNLTRVLHGKGKTLRGLRFCFLSRAQEYYDEITQQMRNKTTVIMPKQVMKVPVLAPVETEKETVTVVGTPKKHGWLRTSLISLFKKFTTALEA